MYHLEKSIIASLHNVTDEYSSNINEAESYLKNKISELTNDSEQVMDFLKQVNELLEIAETADREVAALFQENRERFHIISSKVEKHNGLLSIFRSVSDRIKALAYSYMKIFKLENIFIDLKTKLKNWYMCEGNKKVLMNLGQGILGLKESGLISTALAVGAIGPLIKSGSLFLSRVTNIAVTSTSNKLKNEIKNQIMHLGNVLIQKSKVPMVGYPVIGILYPGKGVELNSINSINNLKKLDINVNLGLIGKVEQSEIITNIIKVAYDVKSKTVDKSKSTAKEKVDTSKMSYEEYLTYRYENAVDENTKKVYEKYKKKIKINNDNYHKGEYDPFWNYINYNKQNDASNARGIGCTYYHEVGHLIDDITDWNGDTSTDGSYKFYKKLKNDVDNYVSKIIKDKGYTDINNAYVDFSKWLKDDGHMKSGVSDLVCGITDRNAKGFWTHPAKYYNKTTIRNEAFAHFFEAGMSADPTILNYIKEVFPTAYEEFQKMLEDILD